MQKRDIRTKLNPLKSQRLFGAFFGAKRKRLTLETARAVFKDPIAIEEVDDRENYGEERFILIGMADNRFVVVAYTMRDEAVRIISARGAEPFEQREYHEQNS